jgi:hypothetical protein
MAGTGRIGEENATQPPNGEDSPWRFTCFEDVGNVPKYFGIGQKIVIVEIVDVIAITKVEGIMSAGIAAVPVGMGTLKDEAVLVGYGRQIQLFDISDHNMLPVFIGLPINGVTRLFKAFPLKGWGNNAEFHLAVHIVPITE